MRKWARRVMAWVLFFAVALYFLKQWSRPFPAELLAKQWDSSWGTGCPGQGKNDPYRTETVRYADSMMGTFYDQTMGRFNDLFGKWGWVVCIDVPVRSYLAAGISFPELLKESARKNPEWYKIGPDNSPADGYFYRRVRNYHDLFQNHPCLETSQRPEVGDWVFYGRSHVALVVETGINGVYNVIEAAPGKLWVAICTGEEMDRTWGKPDFFGRIKASEKSVRKKHGT